MGEPVGGATLPPAPAVGGRLPPAPPAPTPVPPPPVGSGFDPGLVAEPTWPVQPTPTRQAASSTREPLRILVMDQSPPWKKVTSFGRTTNLGCTGPGPKPRGTLRAMRRVRGYTLGLCLAV